MSTLQRLSKVLAAAGVASRRACEELIFEGRVTVNGRVIYVPQTPVSLPNDQITVNGQQIYSVQKKVYYILNKPSGVTCSQKRIGRKRLVTDLFTDQPERLFTVGRLDRDTTGLLIVTNDGHFAQKVIHPSANITKEYLIKVRQEITHEHLVALSKGVFIEGSWVKPVKVTKMRKGTLKIAVKEGKKREVRLMVSEAGLDLIELSRIRIGGLILGPLPEGMYREMTEKDKEAIFH
ncbi:MAG: rRNA pseudouridine synthase [Simkania sp.]|nr:rRNA pseudouridine synthase [Simkania sp.]